MTFAFIRNAVNFYLPLVDDSIDAVEAEFMRWQSYCLRHEDDSLPHNTLGVLLSGKEIHTYPSLEVLQILATGPVTTATNERCCCDYPFSSSGWKYGTNGNSGTCRQPN